MSQGCLCKDGTLRIEDITGPAPSAVGREVVVVTIEIDLGFFTDVAHDRSPAISYE